MTRPMLATKLFVPTPRPGLVKRSRLGDRLRRGRGPRLTLVSAPAGFGKTTLLAEWLGGISGDDRSVAWLSLDPSDNEPAVFWAYVVTALRTAVPGISTDALDLTGSSPLPTELVVSTLLNELNPASGDVWLVLDDYHLIENRDVRNGIAFLLESLPQHVHVVIGTRADPDLPLSRWRVRGELVEIRAADLRFTPDEVAAYFTDVAELDLVAQDVAILEERTEGWIAALQLAALSMRGREDISGFITQFAGTDRYVVDYLVDEVLALQPDEIREFLLLTAVLDRLTGPLCDAVTLRDNGSQLLVGMERANLFLVPLDDRRQWYRYHHLFADVLRAHLIAGQPELVPVLHLRASDWYQRNDLTQEAIGHALAGRDFDRAAYLIELATPAIRRHRQEALLQDWLKVLPDTTIRRSPILGVFSAHMFMVAGDLAAAEGRLDDAERALAAVPAGQAHPWADTEELRTVPATIVIYRASLAQARGDMAGAALQARRAMELAGPDDHLARGGAAGFLGIAAWSDGDVTTALDIFSQALTSLHAAGSLADELSSTVTLADMWLAAGRPSKARRLYRDAIELAGSHGQRVARATADLHVGLSEIDVEAGDLVGARQHLEIAAATGDRSAISERRFRWFVAMALVAKAGGDLERAVDLFGQAERLYRPAFLPDVRPIAAMRARIRIGQGKLSEVVDWTRDVDVSVTDEVTYLGEFNHLTLVRLVLAQHRERPTGNSLDQAADLLARLHRAAETTGRAGSLIEISILQALVQDAKGQRSEAVACLVRALELAPEPDGYVRLFLDEGTPMLSLLRHMERIDVDNPHVRRLLTLDTVPETTSTSSDANQPPDPLSERELQVLTLLATELRGPEIARQLFISHNTLRTHTKHIFTKLGVTNRRAAVLRAHERRLI